VERVGETVVTDGMEIDALGNVYFTAVEKNAVIARKPDGEMVTIAQGPEISWPDSFAWRGNGTLYVSTAQIHRTTMFNGGKPGPATPYNVIRVQPIGPRMGCCVK
jgi:sugar lactone lactonase YvrE